MPVKDRPWEVWQTGIAGQLDDYWRNSPDEVNHRAALATLVWGEMLSPNDSVLEVGCGTGLVYEALLKAVGPRLVYTGMDNSSQMIAQARKVYPELLFRRGDAFKLPVADRTFAIACAFEVFGHMPDCSQAIAELIRVAGHTAIFTAWVWDGDTVRQGSDHYEYPTHTIETAIAISQARLRWEWVQLATTRCYVVRKP